MMGRSAIALAALGFALAGSASAQETPPAAQPASEKVNLVIVYGDDPCPRDAGTGEIVVCGRKEEKERYRIPEPLRGDPNAPANQAWGEQFRSLEYVGKEGTESCSPVGGGGFTGCFEKIGKMAKAERRQADNVSWTDLVAAERAKRLGRIDAESEAIERQVQAEEKAEAAKATAPASSSPNP